MKLQSVRSTDCFVFYRSYINGGKRSLFVAGSLTSVVQNAITIRHLSDLKVGEYCATSQPLDIVNHQVLLN